MAATMYEVTAAAAVIRTKDGSDRYLYKGSRFRSDAADADSIKHLSAVGLIEKVTAAPASETDAESESKTESDETGKDAK